MTADRANRRISTAISPRRSTASRTLGALRRVALVVTGVLLVFLLAAVVLLALQPRSPETPASVADVAALERFLSELVASGNPPGLSVAVVRAGEVVYQRGFGHADGPRRVAASSDTIYKWWSLTKLLTAIAVLELEEEGKLSLDDEVRRYLPWFEATFDGAPSKGVTLGRLLNHSSGLRDLRLEVLRWTHPEGTAPRDRGALFEGVLPRLSRLRFEPGTRAVYSNFGYMILGAVIERASGTTYERYVLEHVFRPLGMERSGFVLDETTRRYAAAGSHAVVDFQTIFLPAIDNVGAYVREVERGRIWFEPFYLDVPAYGGAMGPVNDVARLLLALLDGGELDGNRILEASSVQKMLSEGQVQASASSAAPPSYRRAGMRHGLGFWVFPDERGPRYQHTGAGPGFATILRIYPERSLGIVVMANGTSLDRDGIADLLVGLF